MTPKYRSDIDGLRAIAVLSVLFFHAGISIFSGGYVGVDVFFVISGYLITTIIVREIANNDFSISKFYERRFRRILPALSVVVVGSIVAGALLLSPIGFSDLGGSAIATALFSSNILFYFSSGYFDTPAELKPLLHTWSLAVEEQYYIFFPLLLSFIAKVDARHYLKWLIVLGSLSFITCVAVTYINTAGAFYLIPTRAWELFIGSIIALHVIPEPNNRYVRDALSIIGITLIGLSIFHYSSETLFPGFAAAIPTTGTALIIYSGIGGQSFVGNILSLRPIVFIGLISYSLYLWHWPIIVYTKYYMVTKPSSFDISIMLCIILVLSVFTWRYIETPFRKKKILASKNSLLRISSFVSAVLMCVGIIVVVTDGLPNRYEHIGFLNLDIIDSEWRHWGTCEDVASKVKKSRDLCDIGMEEPKASFILWGDSHARALASGVDLSAKAHGIKGKIATQSACPPLMSIERPNRKWCKEFNEAVLQSIIDTPEIKTVILAARWALSAEGNRYKNEVGNPVRLVDIQSLSASNSSNHELFEIGLARTIEKLIEYKKKVVLVRPVPEIGYDVPSAYYATINTGRDANLLIAPRFEEYLERIKYVDLIFDKLSKKQYIQVVNPSKYLCNGDTCPVIKQGAPLYRDDDHLSTIGSRYVSKSFDKIFN